MAHYSPLRYPGGKGKMYKQTLEILQKNNLIGCTYIESFAGGANLALNLLFNEKVSNIILNDIDPAIYSVWAAILNYGPEFIRLIENTPVTIEERQHQKDIYNARPNDVLSLGFATFYLNRTNRSGIISAGPIGGYNQTGNYLIDCRFNKPRLIERIQRIYKNRNKIQIFDFDARDFLRMEFPENSFFFIDPPYFEKGGQLYQNSFNIQDHREIGEIVSQLNYPWIVTYDNVDEIISLYNFTEYQTYQLTYTVEKKYLGTEVMFYRANLNINLDNNI